LAAGTAVLVGLDSVSAWWLVPALVLVVAALLLAWDRAAALGHVLVAGHLVTRSGSLVRRRETLAVRGIIGWNLRSSWFQRRAGLTTLVATTAGGSQSVTVLDAPLEDAVGLAAEAMPELLEQLLVSSQTHPTGAGRSGL